MPYSQNGWSANNTSLMARYTIPDTSIRVVLRKGDVSVVLLYFLRRFNKEVESLRQSDTGGYAHRDIRGSSSISNHASGTAVDCRWRDHLIGRVGTYTPSQKAAIRKILASMGGVIRWGGNYSGRKDEMHFEIVKGASAVRAMANKIRGGHRYPGRQRIGMTSPAVGSIKAKLRALGYKGLDNNSIFGGGTQKAVEAFQRKKHLVPDGIVGPKTWAALFS